MPLISAPAVPDRWRWFPDAGRRGSFVGVNMYTVNMYTVNMFTFQEGAAHTSPELSAHGRAACSYNFSPQNIRH